jgi:DNA repair protein RadA/Sms
MAAEMKLNVAGGFALGTKVSSIKIPDELRRRHKSGITWFDRSLGGQGLTPSSVTMVTGMPGAGKSTLLRQLADGFAAQGHVVLYNTGEESLEQAKISCERLRLTHDFMVGEETNVQTLLAFLKKLQAKDPKKQVIFLQDSIQTLDDPKYADGGSGGNAATTRCVQELTNWAKDTFGIVVFIGQATKNGDFRGSNIVKHAIDAHAVLRFDNDKKSVTFGSLLFEVPKNRWGSSGEAVVMSLTQTGLRENENFVSANAGEDDEMDAAE